MIILGFLGSPRVNGTNSRLLKKALKGAESRGAETKIFELTKCNIKFCTACFNCVHKNPELPIGECLLEDDMASILKEYIRADGYVFASPNYDGSVTALMKRFLERKIALTYRPKEEYAKIGSARSPANFKKKASMIVTANCTEEYREPMGDPVFELMGGHLMLEQVETVDKLFVGSVENLPDEAFSKRLDEAYQMGIRLVEEIQKAQRED
jgi:multimeric flavodoxin WrbA